jgi:predicted nucleic acid-binding protein
MARIYIETTIPSFYYEVRTQPDMVARRMWTREWFDTDSKNHELVTSATVLMELEQGDFPGRLDAIELVSNLSPVPITIEIEKIVEEYIKRLLMPSNPPLDAVHLALASFYECDFLLTWNCKHLANANKFDNIAKVNAILGLSNPKLVTPLQLLDGA